MVNSNSNTGSASSTNSTVEAVKNSKTAQAGKEIKDDVTARSKKLAESGKNELAREISDLADSLGHTDREEMSEVESLFAKTVLDRAQVAAQRSSEYLQNNSIETMLDDASNFIRKRPEIALGALFVGGILVARVLKGSGEALSDSSEQSSSQRLDKRIGSQSNHQFESDFDSDFSNEPGVGRDTGTHSYQPQTSSTHVPSSRVGRAVSVPSPMKGES